MMVVRLSRRVHLTLPNDRLTDLVRLIVKDVFGGVGGGAGATRSRNCCRLDLLRGAWIAPWWSSFGRQSIIDGDELDGFG